MLEQLDLFAGQPDYTVSTPKPERTIHIVSRKRKSQALVIVPVSPEVNKESTLSVAEPVVENVESSSVIHLPAVVDNPTPLLINDNQVKIPVTRKLVPPKQILQTDVVEENHKHPVIENMQPAAADITTHSSPVLTIITQPKVLSDHSIPDQAPARERKRAIEIVMPRTNKPHIPSRSVSVQQLPAEVETAVAANAPENNAVTRKAPTSRVSSQNDQTRTIQERELPSKLTVSRGRKSLREHIQEAHQLDVPEDEVLYGKQYYAIGEVAAMFRVNTSLIRYWESEFDIIKPRKNGKGDRLFRPDDIRNLEMIHYLLRQKKYTIEGAREYLRTNRRFREKLDLIRELEQLKVFLQEMKISLARS